VKAFTAKNIKAGFAASGLFLFNLDRVLSSMPKLAIGPFTALTTDRVITRLSLQEQIPLNSCNTSVNRRSNISNKRHESIHCVMSIEGA
jgi:hypothetical protein